MDDSPVSDPLDRFRPFTRDDLSVSAPSLVASLSHLDEEVHNIKLENLRSEITGLKKSLAGTNPSLLIHFYDSDVTSIRAFRHNSTRIPI